MSHESNSQNMILPERIFWRRTKVRNDGNERAAPPALCSLVPLLRVRANSTTGTNLLKCGVQYGPGECHAKDHQRASDRHACFSVGLECVRSTTIVQLDDHGATHQSQWVRSIPSR